MNVLIDTNVILDAMTAREQFSQAAQTIFLLAADDAFIGFITASSATDIYYLIHKYGRIGGESFSASECKEKMRKLYELFKPLDVNEADCIAALELDMKDYEDAIMAAVAKRHKIEYIVTRNLPDFKNSPVQAIPPDRFADIFLKGNKHNDKN